MLCVCLGVLHGLFSCFMVNVCCDDLNHVCLCVCVCDVLCDGVWCGLCWFACLCGLDV